MFIGLDGGIDGLVHLSDLSWKEPGEQAVHNYKKGDEVEAVVLTIDTERERISLGIKQLSGDPFSDFAGAHEKGSIVEGTVKSVAPAAPSLISATTLRLISALPKSLRIALKMPRPS
mgnify:CR=1 FL=1